MEKQIQWYPGHMAKAKREIEEKIKLVDIVIELVDARAPQSSRNPMLHEIIGNKKIVLIMTKKDLADAKETEKWIRYYKKEGISAIALNLNNFLEYKKIISVCQEELADITEKNTKKGLKPKAIRALILGIPNVGKSTLINRLAKRKATKTGDRPGVTKAQQLIRIDKDFELFDTPGILWPRFDDELTAKNIALIGSIKSTILPLDDLYIYAMEYLGKNYPCLLKERFSMELDMESEWLNSSFEAIAKARHIQKNNNELNYDRIIEVFFNELLAGKIGRITWEKADGTL